MGKRLASGKMSCKAIQPFYSNAHCAVRILLLAIENTLNLKIRTGADPHSVRTRYGKSQFNAIFRVRKIS